MSAAGVLVLAVSLGGCDSAVRDDSGSVTEAGTANVLELKVSDCLNEPEGSEAETEVVEVVDVSLVPCSEPHDSEVYATFEFARR